MLVFLLSLNVTAFSHTDIIRQAWPSISREEECGRLCPPGTGKSQGHSDGRLVRNTERALRHAQDQGQEEENLSHGTSRYQADLYASTTERIKRQSLM